MAITYTTAKTYARKFLLKMQLKAVLRRTTETSPKTLDKIMMGIEEKWIRVFFIQALNEERLCRAELVLEIDWDEHDLQMSVGKATVAIDEDKWLDNTAIEVDEAINTFKQFVQDYGLNTKWQFEFIPEIQNNPEKLKAKRKELGFVAGERPKWVSKGQGVEMRIPELSELRVGLYLADD